MNLYERLGVSQHSSLKEIKNAYYRQSLRCHPDVGGSASEFHLVKEAYEILSDAKKRIRYNNHIAKPNFQGFDANEFNQAEHGTTEEEISPLAVFTIGLLLMAGAGFGIGVYYHTVIENPPKIMQENINYHKSRAFVLEFTPQDFYKVHHGPGWRYKKS
jgi:curved DNA-binding protein CbpA